jgi:hypothetical protein
MLDNLILNLRDEPIERLVEGGVGCIEDINVSPCTVQIICEQFEYRFSECKYTGRCFFKEKLTKDYLDIWGSNLISL